MRSGTPTTPSTSQRRLRAVILSPWVSLWVVRACRAEVVSVGGATFEVAGRYLESRSTRSGVDRAGVRSIPRGAGLRRRVRHLERGGALVGDLAARGAAEADAVLGAAVHPEERGRAAARVRRHEQHERLLAGTELALDLHLELEGSLRRLRELGEL